MTARNFLIRGLLAGLIAGLFSFAIGYTVGEPPIDAAIAIEEAAAAPAADHAHETGSDHEHGDEGGGISRTIQSTWGLATATVAMGVALGGIVALIAAGVAGRLGRLPLVGSTALVAGLGFVAYSLVPFLKYPAVPPAVGSGDTIGSRTAYYFLFALISVVAMVAAVVLARRLASGMGAYPAVVLAGIAYVAVVAVAALAMPTVNELGDFPADVLWEFRVSSLLTLSALWGSLGIALTWLLRRLEVSQKAAV
ncbi:membrane protein [Microbispora rosea subsp. aerata]|nr:CbtA family protein [Microbispora rosea]GGO16519.1 membrane protein [Microbispora rosea subsp. aerata]GIH56054.1 membrane protein [Microbispora rosea subsp. aerata]GLJ86655.1 membrane protein [Microbispora rosea subsp. aerata]